MALQAPDARQGRAEGRDLAARRPLDPDQPGYTAYVFCKEARQALLRRG